MHPSRANTPALPPIVVVGAGRVGGAIARGGAAAGLQIALAGRADLSGSTPGAAVALLCVPDSEIEAACAALLASAPGLGFVGHTSGATGLEALRTAAGTAAATFSMHPLQTVPDGSAELAGAPAAIEGSSPEALELSRGLAEALGMRPFELPEGARAAYHAAACLASNFLVALEESAVELLGDAGIEEGRDLLAPLVLRRAANWAEAGGDALTGPIARGDERTVDRHLDAIFATSPQLEPLYRVLAERTRALARERQEVGA